MQAVTTVQDESHNNIRPSHFGETAFSYLFQTAQWGENPLCFFIFRMFFRPFLKGKCDMFSPGDAMTIYLDGLWLINGFVDYLLLVVSGKLTACPLRRWRIIVAGALGGFYGVVCVIPGWTFLGSFLWQAVMGMLMCMVAFGRGTGLIRQTGVLFLLTGAFFGVVMLLTEVFSAPASLIGGRVYYPVSIPVLVLTGGGAYGAITWVLGRMSHQGGDIVPVKLLIHGVKIHLTALRDTGNSLRDPVSGVPVMVTDQDLMQQWLPEKLPESPVLWVEEIRRTDPLLRPRLIPYKTVGVAHGLMVAVQPEEVYISGKRERVLIGLSPVAVSDGGGYQALLGGSLV